MFLVLVVCLVAALWGYSHARGQYWRRRGVPHEHSWPLLGTRARFYFLQESIFDYTDRIHNKYPDAIAVGLDTGRDRELLICDPALAKRVLISDFVNYESRGLNVLPVEQIEPLWRNILTVDGEQWRWLRKVLTPGFSPGRIRATFDLVAQRAERLRAHVAGLTPTPVNSCELMTHFAVDFISAYAFGLDVDSINNRDNIFYKIGTNIVRYDTIASITIILKDMFPSVCSKIKYSNRIETDMLSLVKTVQRIRNYKPSGRNDFMDILLGIKLERAEKHLQGFWNMDDEAIAAQAFIFFAAGFETTANATSYTLYLLAKHQEAQERARVEVLATLARHNNIISYEAVKEMTYLTCVLKESLRLFPPVGNLTRKVSRPCYLSGVGALDPGIRIMISSRAFHKDPQYFPDPDEFRPERFYPDNMKSDGKHAYLPFGAGPRSCIGE